MRRHLMVSGCTFLYLFAMLSCAFAIDITADMITKEGKITSNGKLYLKDNKCRAEKGNTPIYSNLHSR